MKRKAYESAKLKSDTDTDLSKNSTNNSHQQTIIEKEKEKETECITSSCKKAPQIWMMTMKEHHLGIDKQQHCPVTCTTWCRYTNANTCWVHVASLCVCAKHRDRCVDEANSFLQGWRSRRSLRWRGWVHWIRCGSLTWGAEVWHAQVHFYVTVVYAEGNSIWQKRKGGGATVILTTGGLRDVTPDGGRRTQPCRDDHSVCVCVCRFPLCSQFG